ncbi:sugar ABC transporter substrate-binding protein [Amphibacillus sp. MSJ-3]|uniref:ABC transporter substrate-binding protein n=1 Tax=Amphibacillus sp. MSJ-3 TaxID=2841505 RepID=UPI001C0F1D59|nr:sugar ABC transporter substrate-binding protein [Amphibacillus sp. MSJ-3]MBU5594252.1 sugar ABC transporter substrate-binding protein [Amphibacillus sp. MSJ-3]
MFKKRDWLAILGVVVFFVMVLTGCGSEDSTGNADAGSDNDGSTEEPVELVFWDENAGPDRTPIWEKLIDEFQKEHTNIKVEYVGLSKDEAKSKLDASIAANDTPDVASLQSSWLPEFSIRGALLPLDDYFENSPLIDTINEGAIQFNKDIVQDGQLYGVPYTQNLDILWIRKDLFDKENMTAPETWDAFFDSVDKMTKNDIYGYTIRGGAGGSLQLQRLMYAYSGITEYIDENGKATVNDPKHAEFLNKYFDLYQKNTPKSDITNDYKEMVAGFDTGKVAILHHNIGSFGEHSKSLEADQFEAAPLPKSINGNYVAEGGNTIGISIFKNTEHPEEAFKLVEFLNNAASQSHWNQIVGQIPTNSEVLEEEWINEAQHIKVAFEVYDNPDTMLYQPPFYLPDYRSILDNKIDPAIQSVMSGEKTVEVFLDEWAEALEASNAKYKEAMQ